MRLGLYKICFFMGFCARINTIFFSPTLCLGTPPNPIIAYTIAQYNIPPRAPVIAIYTTQYWQWQYCVKAWPLQDVRLLNQGALLNTILGTRHLLYCPHFYFGIDVWQYVFSPQAPCFAI